MVGRGSCIMVWWSLLSLLSLIGDIWIGNSIRWNVKGKKCREMWWIGSGLFPSFQSGSHTDSSSRIPPPTAHFRTRKPYSISKSLESFSRTDQGRSITPYSRPQAPTFPVTHRHTSPRIPLCSSFGIENEFKLRTMTLPIGRNYLHTNELIRNKKGLDTDVANCYSNPC